MEKKEQLYEGKAKKVYATEDPNLVIVSYKDDATAFDGAKKGTIVGKGVINNQMTNRLMAKMEKAGIPTHFVEELSERDTLVKKVSIVPLEVIIRNISAGHFASRYGVGNSTSTGRLTHSKPDSTISNSLLLRCLASCFSCACSRFRSCSRKSATSFGTDTCSPL